jgi:hypothetical protein
MRVSKAQRSHSSAHSGPIFSLPSKQGFTPPAWFPAAARISAPRRVFFDVVRIVHFYLNEAFRIHPNLSETFG